MTHNRRFARFAAALLLVAAAATPVFAAHGTADFSRIVAIGDSYTAGFSNGSLNERHQRFSFPAVFARQAAGQQVCEPNASATDNCFAEPLITWPGIPSELMLTGLSLSGVTTAPGQGVPVMTGFGRPYNNLGVPGATLYDLLNTTGREQVPQNTAQVFAPVVLRGLGTPVDQALALHPTFILSWVGGDDFFLAATGGVTTECADTGVPRGCLSTAAQFRANYTALLDKLIAGAPNAGIVVGDFPTNVFQLMPYTSLVPAVVLNPATGQPVLNNGAPIPLVGIINGQPAPLPLGSRVILSSVAKLQTGYGLPPAIAQLPPYNQLPNAGKPLTDADILTPAEQAAIVARIGEFDAVVRDVAGARGIPVADLTGLFTRLASGQTNIAGVPLTTAYIAGGIFSLDGNHLTDIGYTLMANEFIRTTNAAYGTNIPYASLATFFQNNDPTTFEDSAVPTFSSGAIHTLGYLNFAPPSSHPRFRGTIH